MAKYTVGIDEKSWDTFDYLLEGLDKAYNYDYPQNMTSSHSKIKCFKKENPEYHQVPNVLLKGYLKYGVRKSDGMKGLRFKNSDQLHIWGLDILRLARPLPNLHKVRQITLLENRHLTLYSMGELMGSRRPIVLKNYEEDDIHQLMQTDPIFRYLKVNLAFTEYGFQKTCRIRDIIEYLQEYPSTTRSQLEKMGIRGPKMWDLIVNYHPSLDIILRSGSKPDMQYKILSKGQHERRQKREWSLPDSLNDSDIEAGRLKNQSFEAQVFQHVRSDKESFFS